MIQARDSGFDLTSYIAALMQLRGRYSNLRDLAALLASSPPGFLDWLSVFGPEEEDRQIGDALLLALGRM